MTTTESRTEPAAADRVTALAQLSDVLHSRAVRHHYTAFPDAHGAPEVAHLSITTTSGPGLTITARPGAAWRLEIAPEDYADSRIYDGTPAEIRNILLGWLHGTDLLR